MFKASSEVYTLIHVIVTVSPGDWQRSSNEPRIINKSHMTCLELEVYILWLNLMLFSPVLAERLVVLCFRIIQR